MMSFLPFSVFLLVFDYGLRMVEKDGYGIDFAGEKLFDLDFANHTCIALLEKGKINFKHERTSQ